MNKLLLNERARNHIRFFPMTNTITNLPESEADKIKWCESEFKKLQHSNDAKRLFLAKHKSKGYLISVWQLDDLYYMIHCLRNEFKTFNTTIYLSKDKDDCINIAKFLENNIVTIMQDYKQQILEARDQLLRDTANKNENENADA